MVELKIAKCCGSCIHSSRPKQPKETHAAHYEVAKTERWCFKHNCHITRETVCEEDYEGVTRAVKAGMSRALGFNKRLQRIRDIASRMGTNKAFYIPPYYTFTSDGNCLYVSFQNSEARRISGKSASHDRDMDSIEKMLNNSIF